MKKKFFFILLTAALLMLLPMNALAASPESDFGFDNGVITKYKGSDATVVIPSTINGEAVTAIKALAFYQSSVKSVVIPEGVTSIGKMAFHECASLESIIVPSSVTSLDTGVFWSCSSLKSASIPGNISSVPEGTFWGCSSLKSVFIPSSVTSIDNNAFRECSSLQSISIPNGVTSIGSSAFSGCTLMTFVDLPSSVKTIGSYAFGNSSLKELPNISNVTSIGQDAFRNCKFTVATIPACVNEIGNWAFSSTPLTELTFEGQPSLIDSQAFYSVGSVNSPCNLYLPETWTDEEPKAGNGISWKGGTFNVKRADTKDITLISDGHGTVGPDMTSGKIGTEITLTAKPAEGYVFNEWIVLSGGVTVENNQFTIGTDDVVIIASFKESGSAHEHTFSDDWSKDETNHWHAATCEHTDVTSGFAAHSWGTGDKESECSICGYAKPDPAHEHTFADTWSKDETNHWHAATCDHTGMTSDFAAHTWGTGGQANECSDCGYVKPDPAHVHTFSDDWSKDETNHWHAATCEHTDVTSGFAAHGWGTGDKENECSICGYAKPDPAHEHIFADTWSKDETNHWHAATCDHTGMTSDFAAHTWGTGDQANECSDCGYVKPDPAHVHTFSDDWSKDETNHWHAATCGHTDITKGLTAHQFGNDNICDICQYVKEPPVPVDLPLYGIVITTPPNKTTYKEGESFNPTGMVVNALYAKPITNYSLSPFSNLLKTDTDITVSYTENGVTQTALQPITVGPVKEPYKIIVGDDQVVLTTADSAVFSSNADFSKFVRVEVDGSEVSSKYYTAVSGSTRITFNKEYISTLKEGKHTLRIISNDGSASTGFKVMSLPKTGDQTNPTLLMMLLLASMGALLLISASTRKRNED